MARAHIVLQVIGFGRPAAQQQQFEDLFALRRQTAALRTAMRLGRLELRGDLG